MYLSYKYIIFKANTFVNRDVYKRQVYAGAALLLGAVDREELLALPGGEKLARLLRLK